LILDVQQNIKVNELNYIIFLEKN